MLNIVVKHGGEHTCQHTETIDGEGQYSPVVAGFKGFMQQQDRGSNRHQQPKSVRQIIRLFFAFTIGF